MKPSILTANNVSKTFPSPCGDVQVLRHVNLTIKEGEFLMVTGPSGSGKTTFLNLASLLDYSTTGRLEFDNEDISNLNEDQLCNIRKDKVGIVFQKFCLLSYRSIWENVMFRFRYLDNKPDNIQKQTERILCLLGLDTIAQQPVRLLSSGERQRVAIARAVVLRPKLLVADEPTGNLDDESSHSVMQCFEQLNKDGITILMVTHDKTLLDYGSRHVECKNGYIDDEK